MKILETRIGNCSREDFSEGVGQVGEGYVQGFHDPDTPQQEIGTVSSIARSRQEFGPRRDQWVKMVDECMRARSVREKVLCRKRKL